MNKNYQEITIQFDENAPIKHRPKPMVTSLPTVFSETIDFNRDGSMFIGARVEIRFEFNDELFLLTEIRFESEPATRNNTSLLNNTTLCPPVRTSNSTLESSSLVLFTFEWLTIVLVSIFSLGFVLLLLVGLCGRRQLRHRRRRLRQNSHLYYKSSQMTATTSGSCVSTSSEHDAHTLPIAQVNKHFFQTNNYDDVTSEQQSMGSYIYPITSTTSLLQTSPPSSLCKGEQYAVIDGTYSCNPYQHWSTNHVRTSSNDANRSTVAVRLLDLSLRFVGYRTDESDRRQSTFEFIQLRSSDGSFSVDSIDDPSASWSRSEQTNGIT